MIFIKYETANSNHMSRKIVKRAGVNFSERSDDLQEPFEVHL